mgnify:CR=1 FL=1|jgi:hypothetical protein
MSYNFKIGELKENARYTVSTVDKWAGSAKTGEMSGASSKSFANGCAHLYDIHAEEITAVLASAMQTLQQRKDRSAWSRGVTAYAVDMLQQIADYYKDGYISADDLGTWATAEAVALNGARDWSEYSWGGSAFVYDGDIAAALCAPSELERTRNGVRRPNSREEWLDVQARALHQAFRRMYGAIRAAVPAGRP